MASDKIFASAPSFLYYRKKIWKKIYFAKDDTGDENIDYRAIGVKVAKQLRVKVGDSLLVLILVGMILLCIFIQDFRERDPRLRGITRERFAQLLCC